MISEIKGTLTLLSSRFVFLIASLVMDNFALLQQKEEQEKRKQVNL